MNTRKAWCFKHGFSKNNLRQISTFFSDEVNSALKKKSPILALESTIITHGLPHPHNHDLALSVQSLCRRKKVTPATIAILRGKVSVGLEDDMLAHLSNGSKDFIKISRRDLAPSLQQGLTGGTTVSGTMLLAHKYNIDVFATGGIGGVHRGGQETLDISADLSELGRTPVAVVCAGVKSILDIQRTLEVLETNGVTVATFGETRDFPAFFTAKSGYNSHTNVRNAKEAAELIFMNKKLKLDSGIVIAVPIPDKFAADGLEIESAISTALKEAEEQKIVGHSVTPFLLARLSELTSGRSLQTNLALVHNNVSVGCDIAVELRNCMDKENQRTFKNGIGGKGMLVVGAINVDIVCTKLIEASVGKDLAQGLINHVVGGVSRNVAECLSRCGTPSSLISIVGDDKMGKMALELCKDSGMKTDKVTVIGGISTPIAQLSFADGNVSEGVADFSSHSHIKSDMISDSDIQNSSHVIIDCDIPLETAVNLAERCLKFSVPLVIEPTAPTKFQNFVEAGLLKMSSMVTPNVSELALILPAPLDNFSLPHSFDIPVNMVDIVVNMLRCIEVMSDRYENRTVLTTLGDQGVLYSSLSSHGWLDVVYLPSAPETVTIKSSSGAGDSFLGGYFSAMNKGHTVEQCLKIGTVCAWESLRVFETINPELDMKQVYCMVEKWESLGWKSEKLFSGKFEFSDIYS